MSTSYKRKTVKLNMAKFDKWCQIAVKRILADLANPKCHLHGRQDYFTATDLEACIKLIAAEEAGDTLYRSNEPAGWWGYGAGFGSTRIVVTDKPYRTNLLSLCRTFLADMLHDGILEGHNFGRGHCSGMRFRPAGSGISPTEQETINRKDKPKPKHAMQSNVAPLNYGLLCMKDRKSSSGWSRHRRQSTHLKDDTQVTCKRCLSILSKLTDEEKQARTTTDEN